MKDFRFDLQLFAGEEETTGTSMATQQEQQQGQQSGQEYETQSQQETPAAQEPEEIPEELDGLPEEIAREAMEEATTKMEQSEKTAETENSDNKPSKGAPINTAVPYPRFKEQVDKTNNLEAQLAAYRAKYGELGGDNRPAAETPKPAEQTTPPQPPNRPTEQQQIVGGGFIPQFTPEISAQIEEVVKQKALQMTGMTAEDATALEDYGDEDSPKLKMLENAKSMARQMVIGEITEAVRQQHAQRAAYIRQHQNMINDYNAFVQRESAEPDFAKVQAYAVGDYFEQLSEVEQTALRAAYARTEGQKASPQDIMLVKRYFAEAKAAFRRSKQPDTPQQVTVRQQAKSSTARPTLPRAAEVDGSASAPAEGITNESLAKMLDEMDPDEIPEQYRKLLMG